jgi:hypothetical protein
MCSRGGEPPSILTGHEIHISVPADQHVVFVLSNSRVWVDWLVVVTSLSSESVKKCNVSIETLSCSYPTLRLTLNSVIFESYVSVVVKD